MLKLLVIEIFIVFILILIACHLKKYVFGIAMLVAVALGFACTANGDGMIFWAPVIFGIPILIAVRGRSLPLEKRKHLEEKYAYMRDPSPLGAFLFMTFILAHGLNPRNKQEHSNDSVKGISLTDVLK